MKSLLINLTQNAPLKRLALFLFSVLFSALLLTDPLFNHMFLDTQQRNCLPMP